MRSVRTAPRPSRVQLLCQQCGKRPTAELIAWKGRRVLICGMRNATSVSKSLFEISPPGSSMATTLRRSNAALASDQGATLRTILVGVDGSPASSSVVALGIAWARRFDALLVGIGVIDEPALRGRHV